MFDLCAIKSNSNFVISTEGRNHTRNSTKIGDFDCVVSGVISPFGRNDKKLHKNCLFKIARIIH